MGIMANTSRQQGSVISARHGSTMAQSLRQAGVTPQIDLNTGEFTGAFGDLFKDTVEGRMSDMVMQAQMELQRAIGAREQARQNGNMGRVRQLDTQIAARREALRNTGNFRRAAETQTRDALGLPDLSKLTPGVTIPQGSKINLGGAVRDQSTVLLRDIFNQNRYSSQQQHGVLEEMKRTLLEGTDWSATHANLLREGVTLNAAAGGHEAQVRDFLSNLNNLTSLNLDQLKGFVDESGRKLVETREFRPPAKTETAAERAMRLAQDRVTSATDRLAAQMRLLNQTLEQQARNTVAGGMPLDFQLLEDALENQLGDLRVQIIGERGAVQDWWAANTPWGSGVAGDNLGEIITGAGFGDMAQVTSMLELAATELGKNGRTIDAALKDSDAQFQADIRSNATLAGLNGEQVKVLFAILKVLSKSTGGPGLQAFRQVTDKNQARRRG